jgi:type II secretory pathway pseudopilin PulG
MEKKIKFFLGFTAIELILVIALISSSLAIVSPIYFSSKTKNDLRLSSEVLVDSLRRAQNLSMAVSDDSSWGVKIDDSVGMVTIFKGDSYSTREDVLDEEVCLSSNIYFSGTNEIVFSKFYGRPSFVGELSLRSRDGQFLFISINKLGVVSY